MTEYQQLCQELYKLKPVWDEKHRIDWFIDGSVWDTTMQSDYETGGEDWQSPAYDLEYLLEKLESLEYGVLLRYNKEAEALKHWNNRYCAGTFDMPQGEYPVADTPTNAVLKLAIQLVKKGQYR